jgi:hypothetical protein
MLCYNITCCNVIFFFKKFSSSDSAGNNTVGAGRARDERAATFALLRVNVAGAARSYNGYFNGALEK